MLKKAISAALVVVMMSWAEMAMAPMLAMHVWQSRPTHEMAANLAAHHHHAMSAEHPCCPKIEAKKTEDVAPVKFAVSSLPCQDQHRCCFVQGPQNVPTPVKAGQQLSQEVSLVETVELTPVPVRAHIPLDPGVAPGSPPDLLSMIFRV